MAQSGKFYGRRASSPVQQRATLFETLVNYILKVKLRLRSIASFRSRGKKAVQHCILKKPRARQRNLMEISAGHGSDFGARNRQEDSHEAKFEETLSD